MQEINASRWRQWGWRAGQLATDVLGLLGLAGVAVAPAVAVMASARSTVLLGGSDGRGVGFYFRNVTELVLFGVRGKNARTLAPGRRQVNHLESRKREHSRKPDELYPIIEACSPAPRLELFARGARDGWSVWGNQADGGYEPDWKTYAHNSAAERRPLAVD